MPLLVVCESPPNLCLNVTDSQTRLNMADASIDGIKGCLVCEVNIETSWVQALLLGIVTKASSSVKKIPEARLSKTSDKDTLGIGIGRNHRAQLFVLTLVQGQGSRS